MVFVQPSIKDPVDLMRPPIDGNFTPAVNEKATVDDDVLARDSCAISSLKYRHLQQHSTTRRNQWAYRCRCMCSSSDPGTGTTERMQPCTGFWACRHRMEQPVNSIHAFTSLLYCSNPPTVSIPQSPPSPPPSLTHTPAGIRRRRRCWIGSVVEVHEASRRHPEGVWRILHLITHSCRLHQYLSRVRCSAPSCGDGPAPMTRGS